MTPIRAHFALALLPLIAPACGPGRTSAATRPTAPHEFDASKSDPKALAIADQVLAAVGAPRWEQVKEIRWHQTISTSGRTTFHGEHAWDRWNGRHYGVIERDGLTFKVMQDLYGDRGVGFVVNDGRDRPADSDDEKRMLTEAKTLWERDSYLLCMPFKLRDPGVHLAYDGERPAKEGGPPNDVLKVTFDPGVGTSSGDIYYLIIDRETHLVDAVEIEQPGKPGRAGLEWSDWVDVDGLKFARVRRDLAAAQTEIKFSEIRVSNSPDEDLYTPRVQ